VNLSQVIKTCHDLDLTGTSYALVTMIRIDAHVPQEVGAKMIVTAAGLHAGTIGGGKLEAKGIQLAQQQLVDKKHAAQLHRIDLNQDLGMVCGGVATIFIEATIHDSWSIAIYGAGHVSQALTNLLVSLNCQLTVTDTREDWLGKIKDRHGARVKTILTDDLAKIPATFPEKTYHVIATPGHVHDLVVVREALKLKSAPYIGVIGSIVKARKIRATLLEEGLTREETEQFHCPMGLPIGNNTPEEIAVSIAAHLLQTRG
jgi:xanthine dehydrogenase accessory factor